MSRTPRLRLIAPVASALIVALIAGPAAASEPLPGPPARPGEVPIGGPLLTGSKVVYKPVDGASIDPPEMDAAAWMLSDADTGEVLAAKAPHARYRPASTLKTLTAVTLMPRLDPEARYKAQTADTKADGSQVGLAVGVQYTVDQLWHALLLPSANDAASALANANGGVAKTVEQMNAKALRLQALDTVAKTPSGLDADGQWTSAYDMSLIARAAIGIPEFVAISSTKTAKFPDVEPTDGARRTHTIYGQNRLLNYGYPGVIAGKTGFTTEGKRTFWAAAKQDGRTLIVSLFRIDGATEAASRTLLNWGFRNADQLQPIGTLVAPLTDEQLTASTDPRAVTELDGAVLTSASPTEEQGSTPWGAIGLIIVLALGAVAALRLRAVRKEHQAVIDRELRRRSDEATSAPVGDDYLTGV